MSRPDRRLLFLRGMAVSIYRRGIHAVAWLAAVYLLVLIGSTLYYKLLPGEWFVDYYRAEVTSVEEGQDVPLTLCRTRRISDIQAEATRTFYRRDEDVTDRVVYRFAGQYSYGFSIEGGRDCQAVLISIERYRHTPGTYYAHTDVSFVVNGERKTTGYDTTPYVITTAPSNAQLQLEIQRKIDDLQRQLDELKADAEVVSTATTQPPESTPAAQRNEPTVAGGSSGGEEDTNASPAGSPAATEPSEKPSTPPAEKPDQQSAVQQLLRPVTDTVTQL